MKKTVLFLMMCLLATTQMWGQWFSFEGLNYRVTSNTVPRTVEVARNANASGNIVIPTSVKYDGINYAVESIENSAFAYCSSLTSIEIPNSVESFGNNAFWGCSSLTFIEIPSGATSIEAGTFGRCSSLTSIEIPSSVTSIGSSAFRGCSSLTSINIPSGVTSIEEWTFSGCSGLTSIEIPSGVTSIGIDAFSNCSSLTSINIPSGITSIERYAFSGCSSLTSVSIPSSVTSIENHVFWGCSSLTSVSIPSSVTSIENYTFQNCSSLTSIEIPSSVTSIEIGAFSGCSSLTSIEIPNSVTSIEGSTFSGCSSLTSIEIPNSVTSIGNGAFSGCSSLTSIKIPSGVTSIEDYVFRGCSSLTSIEIPNSVESFGNYAFDGCSSLTLIEIPSSVTSIGEWAFAECSSLTSFEIPSGVTSIGEWTFRYCYNLTSIEIPSSVTSIEIGAFSGCYSLAKITCHSQTPIDISSYWNYEFSGVNVSACKLYVPAEAVEAYQAARIWKDFDIRAISDTTYAVVLSANDDLFGAVIGSGTFDEKAEIIITATANNGYQFINWTENNQEVSTDSEYTFIVESDRALVANFAPIKYAITVSSNNDEYSTVNGNGSVDFGTETTVTATAATGYQFINWTENDQEVSTDSEYKFIVESDRALVANFVPIKYTITVSSNNNEYGVANGNDSIDFGTETTVTATATPGYQFINWTENNQEVSTDSEYKFIVENDRALIANFAPIKYTITVSSNNDEYGVVNGNNSIDFGTETTVTAIANEGHRFINWTENGQEVSTDSIYTFIVECDRTLIANFVAVNNTVVVEEPKPIESDGKGSIDFSLEIAGDASITGSFNIQLPEGYTLDETSTFLSETLAELFKLVITLAGDNTWRIEIVANGLRADQALPEYTKIMTIGYIVDETVQNGNYEIELKDIDMVLEDGTIIEQETIVVATEVLRDDVGMSLVSSTPVIVYFQNENLVVKCDVSEVIAVYNLSGTKLIQVIAQNNETYIPLPQGAYIIQVGNKTVKRIKNWRKAQ